MGKWFFCQEGCGGGSSGMEFLEMSFDTLEEAMVEAQRQLQVDYEVKSDDPHYTYTDDENLHPSLFPILPQPTGTSWVVGIDCVYELPEETTERRIVLLAQVDGCTQYVVTQTYLKTLQGEVALVP